MHKYIDIERLKASYEKVFTKGENVVIQTKIDGANASFTYDPSTKSVVAFSRNTVLDKDNTLRGFYEFTQLFDSEAMAAITFNGRYIIYGEWLVKHKVKYPDSCYNKFYMFDVYDTQIGQYIPYKRAASEFYGLILLLAHITGIANMVEFAPVVYEGEFCSWEHVRELLATKTLGGEPCEEGVVIKSQDRLNNKYSKTPAYVKIVNEQFSEVKNTKSAKKVMSPEELAAFERDKEAACSIITKRRVEKFLDKFVDKGIIDEDWDEKSLGIIMKKLPSAIYEDCVKEEPEIVNQINNFGKLNGKIVSEYVREILSER